MNHQDPWIVTWELKEKTRRKHLSTKFLGNLFSYRLFLFHSEICAVFNIVTVFMCLDEMTHLGDWYLCECVMWCSWIECKETVGPWWRNELFWGKFYFIAAILRKWDVNIMESWFLMNIDGLIFIPRKKKVKILPSSCSRVQAAFLLACSRHILHVRPAFHWGINKQVCCWFEAATGLHYWS